MPKTNKYCLGCGILKQTTDENKPGYIMDLEHELCLDCFKLKNYGKVTSHFNPETYDDIDENSLILIVQSVMQLDSLFTLPIYRIQPNAKYVYLINQMDLLPPETNLDHIYKNIKRKARNLKIKHMDIVFMSALNNYDLDNLKMFIDSFKENKIYLFGFQNSGKSTIFKSLTNNPNVLSLNKAGLTLDVIEGKVGNKTIYDMPGVYIDGILSTFFDYEVYKHLLPSKTIFPKVYIFNKNQRLVLEDFIEITTNDDEDVQLIFYLNPKVNIKRYNINNKTNHLNDDLKYTNKTFNVRTTKSHIQIADLGFILINPKVNISIKYPVKMHLTQMESLIKWHMKSF